MPRDATPAPRPHSGRRRNEATREAIHAAVLALLADPAGAGFTMDAVAAAAGAGKQTLYRWWPSKAALLAEVMAEKAAIEIPEPDTGSLQGDLTAFFSAMFGAARDRAIARGLQTIMAEAQTDAQAAEALALYTDERRQVLHSLFRRSRDRGEISPMTDTDLLEDQAFGFIWYRLLLGHASLTDDVAARLAAGLVRQAENTRGRRLSSAPQTGANGRSSDLVRARGVEPPPPQGPGPKPGASAIPPRPQWRQPRPGGRLSGLRPGVPRPSWPR